MMFSSVSRMSLMSAGLALFTACSETAAEKGDVSLARSLTGKTFTGKKYYFGWGHAADGDPASMHNEVKYDVLHTHEIFTKELGGSYAGTKLLSNGSTPAIVSGFDQLKSQIGPQDMFVQYSSGHGFQQGLQFGGSYEEISSRVLSLQAKEIIIFTMACHSGGLVDTFNNKKSQWSSFAQQGRTLFVMSSSTIAQTSSTGPGQDGLGGPYGSAGSAFGHALWKALAGEADGAYDGIRDGYIDLGEIESFTKARTRQIGGHDPVTTGSYNPALIMNRVPTSTDNLTYADRGTTNASNEQLQQWIAEEDSQWNFKPLARE